MHSCRANRRQDLVHGSKPFSTSHVNYAVARNVSATTITDRVVHGTIMLESVLEGGTGLCSNCLWHADVRSVLPLLPCCCVLRVDNGIAFASGLPTSSCGKSPQKAPGNLWYVLQSNRVQ